MKTSEFRERLLVALLLRAQEGGLGGYYQPKEAADRAGLQRRPGQLRLVIRDLDDRGLLRPSYTMGSGDEESGLDSRLTNAGVEEAEELLEQHPEYATPFLAPAVDRYVKFSDNQRTEVEADVEALRSKVLSANEAGDEERQIALSEIAIFEAAIAQPRISSELIARFVNRILAWIRSKFGEALISAVAGALIVKLLPFLAS